MNLIELAERLECLSIGNPAITFTDKADLERAAAVLRQQAEPAPDAELLRSELDRAWREVDFISKERTEHLEWRTKLANDLDECERMRDALGVALNKRENDLTTAQAVPSDVSTVETAAWMICEPGCKYGPTFGTENAAWIALTKAPPGSELVELVRRKA